MQTTAGSWLNSRLVVTGAAEAEHARLVASGRAGARLNMAELMTDIMRAHTRGWFTWCLLVKARERAVEADDIAFVGSVEQGWSQAGDGMPLSDRQFAWLLRLAYGI